MMPMPPTTSETPAIAQKEAGHDVGRGGGGVGDFLLVAHGEIIVACRRGCYAAAEEAPMICCCADASRPRHADLHVDVAQGGAADDAFHGAGVRHDHDVVLVGALQAEALWA